MTDTLPKIDYNTLFHHASQLPQALDDARQHCEEIDNLLLDLVNNRCTGSEHWRDANTDGKKAKLYIIHPLTHACPIHGIPEPGKRIRTYVGSNPAKIEAAREAVTRNRHYNNAIRELLRIHRALKRAHYDIRQAWDELGLTPPDPPATDAPPT